MTNWRQQDYGAFSGFGDLGKERKQNTSTYASCFRHRPCLASGSQPTSDFPRVQALLEVQSSLKIHSCSHKSVSLGNSCLELLGRDARRRKTFQCAPCSVNFATEFDELLFYLHVLQHARLVQPLNGPMMSPTAGIQGLRNCGPQFSKP